MEKTDQIIRDQLVKGLREMYEACTNPNKSEKCLEFDHAHDIICKNKTIINIRQQIMWIDEHIKS